MVQRERIFKSSRFFPRLLIVQKNVLQPRHEFARALLISSLGLLINSCFTSIAYQYYWPVMCAFGVGCQRVAQLEAAENAGLPVPAGPVTMPRPRLRLTAPALSR